MNKGQISIYTLAGMRTSSHFMEEFRLQLTHRFQTKGWEVHSSSLFPYGDWNRSLLRQIHEIRQDLFPFALRKALWIAGKRAAEAIMNCPKSGSLLIIGHSGGGIAGVHAAQLLLQENQRSNHFNHIHVVQIGSPKCAIPPPLKESVLYVRSLNLSGKISDPVTRLGSWGGWTRNRFQIPVWNKSLYSPFSIVDLQLIGGHQDYFRNTASFRNKHGETNLNVLNQTLWNWLIKQNSMNL